MLNMNPPKKQTKKPRAVNIKSLPCDNFTDNSNILKRYKPNDAIPTLHNWRLCEEAREQNWRFLSNANKHGSENEDMSVH